MPRPIRPEPYTLGVMALAAPQLRELALPAPEPGRAVHRNYRIELPRLGEIVTIAPSAALPVSQQKRQAREIARRIRESPLPEWRHQWGEVHVMLDNIEDAMTTALVTGRLAARWAPRIIPGLGVLAAGDVMLNAAVTIMRMPYPGSTKKLKLLAQAKNTPRKTLVNAYRGVRPLRGFPTIGETLEIAQTADWLFGKGLSLGPIFGTFEEALYAGAAIGVQNLRRGYVTPAQRDFYETLTTGPLLFRAGHGLGREIEINLAAATALQLQRALERMEQGVRVDLQNPRITNMRKPLRPLMQTRQLIVDVLTEEGWRWPEPRRWPVPGEPELLTVEDMVQLAQEEAPGWLATIEDRGAGSDEDAWLGAISAEIGAAVADLWAGAEGSAFLEPGLEAKLLGELLDRNARLTGIPEPTRWRALLARVAADYGGDGRLSLPTEDLRALLASYELPFELPRTTP